MLKFDLKRLKAERVANGLTQEDMSKGMGYKSKSTYSRKENGHALIGVDEFAKMIDILGYDKDQMSLFFTLKVDNRELTNQNS